MTTVVIEHPRGVQRIEVDEESSLVDLCDEHGLAVAFSCRATTCGTCRVSVIDGHDLLDKPGEREHDLLAQLRSTAGHRFACALRIKPGNGLVRLRIPSSDPCSRL